MKGNKLHTFIMLIAIGLTSNFAIAQSVEPGATVFLVYKQSDDRSDVNGQDAIGMFNTQLSGKTSLNIVPELTDADFIMELTVVKSMADNRRGRAVLKRSDNDQVVFETKWLRGTSNAFSAFSGTRHTIQKITKQLIKKFPPIER